MKRIYCISGLATDHRLFETLSVPQYELVPLLWATYDHSDDMESYADKISRQIRDESPIIIGLSFGGMLSVEIGKKFPSWRIFLVSSAKTAAEVGYKGSILRWLSRKNLIPSALFNKPNFYTLARFGAKTPEDKKFISRIISSSNPDFMRWCVNAVFNWDNDSYPDNITHIHGTDDKIIYPQNVQAHYWVEGGSHMMIYNRGAEVGKIIADCLAGLR